MVYVLFLWLAGDADVEESSDLDREDNLIKTIEKIMEAEETFAALNVIKCPHINIIGHQVCTPVLYRL